MITRGEIKSIDWTSNTCNVRIPLFETVGTKDEIIMPALFCTPPGICNGYSEGDIVWVGFEFGETYSKVVILGKLFIDTNTEKNIRGSGITCADLIVKNSAILPINTKIDNYLGTDVQNTEVALTKFETLQDIITAISNQSVKITQLFENGSSEGGSTIVPNPGNTTDTLSSIGIDGINYSISGSGGGTTVNAVLYVSQGLSVSQQLQARTNISAAASNHVHSWNSITDKPTIPTIGNLNTSNGSSLPINASESFSNTINLHKIAKTGSYTDLSDKPAIPTTLAELADDSTHRLVTDTAINTWNAKQNALTPGSNISIVGNEISAVNTTYTPGANISISANNEISATNTTYSPGTNISIDASNVISAVDTKYTPGTNISIDANNVISATNTTYSAGTGIDITNNVISITATQGAVTYYPSDQDQVINSDVYLTGNQTIKAVTVSNLIPSNIVDGVIVSIGDATNPASIRSVRGTATTGGGGITESTGAGNILVNNTDVGDITWSLIGSQLVLHFSILEPGTPFSPGTAELTGLPAVTFAANNFVAITRLSPSVISNIAQVSIIKSTTNGNAVVTLTTDSINDLEHLPKLNNYTFTILCNAS